MLADELKRVFDDAGGSDALVDLLARLGLESSRELADILVIPKETGDWRASKAPATDADREAGKSLLKGMAKLLRRYRAGDALEIATAELVVKAFAKHAAQARAAERAEIVAWLRGQAAIYNDQNPSLAELPEWTLAQKWSNAIERGAHKEPKP